MLAGEDQTAVQVALDLFCCFRPVHGSNCKGALQKSSYPLTLNDCAVYSIAKPRGGGGRNDPCHTPTTIWSYLERHDGDRVLRSVRHARRADVPVVESHTFDQTAADLVGAVVDGLTALFDIEGADPPRQRRG